MVSQTIVLISPTLNDLAISTSILGVLGWRNSILWHTSCCLSISHLQSPKWLCYNISNEDKRILVGIYRNKYEQHERNVSDIKKWGACAKRCSETALDIGYPLFSCQPSFGLVLFTLCRSGLEVDWASKNVWCCSLDCPLRAVGGSLTGIGVTELLFSSFLRNRKNCTWCWVQ